MTDLSILANGEHKQPPDKWSFLQADERSQLCTHELLSAQAASTPDAIALVYSECYLSYAEVERRSNQLAHVLQPHGVGPECLVAVSLERSPELLFALLGVLKAGGAYMPLDPTYPVERLAYMVQDSGVRLLLTQDSLRTRFPTSLHILSLEHILAILDQQSEEPPTSGVSGENLAYVIYTSGSTGHPKGVQIVHRGLNNLVWAQKQAFGVHSDHRVLQFASINFDASVSEVFVTLLAGATLCLGSREQLLPGAPLTSLLHEQAISMVTLPPSALAALDTSKLTAIDTMIVAGEACPIDLARKWAEQHRFINAYGPTEYTVCATTSRYEVGSPLLSLGDPIANTEIYILDEQQQPVPNGAPGELYLSGAGLARGYLSRPELTAERFIPDPFSNEPGARLYRTGDRVRTHSNGALEFLGRVDQQIKLRGYRVELGEIESVLRSQVGVREAVVLLREDVPGDQRLVAYLVEEANQRLEIPSLRSALQQRLPDYMIPAAFVVLGALPLLANGKLNRQALPAPDQERRDVATPFIAPHTEIERGLARIWCEILGLTRVGIHDNFFDLGGHSLRATLVQSGISDMFKVDISLSSIFALPTIAELASVVEENIRAGNQQETVLVQPAARDGDLPLSFAQERVWFINQLNPDNLAYNAQALIRFNGDLNITALRQALTEIVRRHEIFRTTFPTANGQPVQKIHAGWSVALPLRDLRSLPVAEREAAAGDIIAEEGRWRFDLTRLPLVRWTLLQLHEHEYILCYVEHHLVHDGWSFTVFLRDLRDLYAAFNANKPSPLPELPLQFADFACRQRQWLQEEQGTAEIQRTYWKNKLANLPEVIRLPYDHPRPPVPSFQGTAFRITLPPVLAEELRLLSRKEGVTLYMLLFATFNTLLYRYSGQETIPVGSSIANRRWKGTSHLIGMVLNNIVLCTHLTGNLTFQELLQRVRAEAIEAYLHQDLPFDKVVEAVRPTRDLSYNPLFQVAFNFHDSPMPDLHFPGLMVNIQEALNNGSSKFDLSLTVIPRAEQQAGSHKEKEQTITLVWEYSTDLFESTTVARMLKHFQSLLESIVVNPLSTLSELPMLTPDEQEQLLAMCTGPRVNWQDERRVHELVSLQAASTPDAIALVYNERHLSYAEIERYSNQLAHLLQQRGIGAQSLVGVALERSPEMILALLAVLKTGAAYVPLDPAYPSERLEYMLRDSESSLLLTQSSLQSRFVLSIPVLCLDQEWAAITRQNATYPKKILNGEQLAYVIYTSGSTGKPKGVQITHRSLTNLLLIMRQQPGISTQDRLLAVTTLSFDIAELELYLPLITGAQVILADREIVADGVRLAEQIQTEEVTIMQATPATWRLLLETGWMGRAGLKIFCGGEALSRDLARQLVERAAEVWNMYGPTEATIYSTIWQVSATAEAISIGGPIANTQAYILDRSLRLVPIGVAGELYLGGTGLARGYQNRPELTAERFIPDPFKQEPGARLYRTGDLARYLADGNLECLGRIDHQVKVRGFRIEPGEVESALCSQSSVREAVILLREDSPGDQRLVAYVVPEIDSTLDASTLRNALKQLLPDYMIPAAFVFLEALPLLANGKLDRHSLPAPDQARPELADPFVAPRTELEQMLVRVWSEVLGITQVGIHDNFFDLGGHSLLIPQVYSRLSKVGIAGLTVVDLFQYPTIKMLAEHLEQIHNQEKVQTFALTHRTRAAIRRETLEKQSGLRQQRKSLAEAKTILE